MWHGNLAFHDAISDNLIFLIHHRESYKSRATPVFIEVRDELNV